MSSGFLINFFPYVLCVRRVDVFFSLFFRYNTTEKKIEVAVEVAEEKSFTLRKIDTALNIKFETPNLLVEKCRSFAFHFYHISNL